MAVSCVERPLFAKEGKFLPFVMGGKEGFSLLCLHHYGLTSKFELLIENGTGRL